MSAPTVTSVTAASPAAAGRPGRGRRAPEPQRARAARRHRFPAAQRRERPQRPGPARRRALATASSRSTRSAGEPLGVEVSSAVFDRIRTCDNHCAFCFIYQLPKGMRRSLYLKDDDYRLSFLYGNFTTLTRFTELDAERILDRAASGRSSSPSTPPTPSCGRSMLRNPKGATSLRWLQVLLDGGIEVHGQVVVCPGVNDGAALEDTLAGILDRYPALATRRASCPSGSAATPPSPSMRPHTDGRGGPRCSTASRSGRRSSAGRSVVAWCTPPTSTTSWPGAPFPAADAYEGFPSTRTASAWPAPSSDVLRPPAARRPGRCAPRVLRLGRRGARRGLPAPHAAVPTAPAGHRRSAPSTVAHRRPTAPACSGPCSRRPRARGRRRCVAVRQRLLRRQHRRRRPAHRRATWPAPWPTCPPAHRYLLARRLPQRGPLPRRSAPSPTCPRPVEVVPTDGRSLRSRARRHAPSGRRARHEPPDGRRGRPAQRRQVLAGQPHRRRARRGRGGGAGGHPRPQGARPPIGPGFPSPSWTPGLAGRRATRSTPR